MQGYSEADVARSGRKTRSSAGPLVEAGRDFADDDMHEYKNTAAADTEEDLLSEDEDEDKVTHCVMGYAVLCPASVFNTSTTCFCDFVPIS